MSERIDTIVEVAERNLGETVVKVTAPGGKGRASFRLYFEDRSVIATWRPNFRRTHLEAYALKSLSEVADVAPAVVALDGEILFQSDVGTRRLNAEMARQDSAGQKRLAEEAVASIFRLQMAARQTDLAEVLPHLGNTRDWVANMVDAAAILQNFGPGLPAGFDAAAAKQALIVPCTQFVKWDCRSGNAALDDAGVMRWFDFEYAGVRHGAEDFAWLIGDETWPRPAEEMHETVRDAYPADFGQDWQDYSRYLSLYITFHCIQRFKLILNEATSKGWLTQQKALTYDHVGIHPVFAAHICEVGAYFADQNALTRALVPMFDATAKVFTDMVLQAETARA